jgi:hypothetical protein
MTRKRKRSAPTIRPYWIPPGVVFEELPEAVRIALQTIVGLAYSELVLGAGDPLETAMGTSVAFLAALEICDQVEIGHQLLRTTPPDGRLKPESRRNRVLIPTAAARPRLPSPKLQLRIVLAGLQADTKVAELCPPRRDYGGSVLSTA